MSKNNQNARMAVEIVIRKLKKKSYKKVGQYYAPGEIVQWMAHFMPSCQTGGTGSWK
ncbi:MAG TPA: hypothetical protein VK469_23580 [Candidatus Kapabacteria bacterium]|nr:hypothetical protein [Candidatus Kapabacteria bacterium]